MINHYEQILKLAEEQGIILTEEKKTELLKMQTEIDALYTAILENQKNFGTPNIFIKAGTDISEGYMTLIKIEPDPNLKDDEWYIK